MTAPSFLDALAAAVAAVLEAHILTTSLIPAVPALRQQARTGAECACGWRDGWREETWFIEDAEALHRAHVAAVLASGINDGLRKAMGMAAYGASETLTDDAFIRAFIAAAQSRT